MKKKDKYSEIMARELSRKPDCKGVIIRLHTTFKDGVHRQVIKEDARKSCKNKECETCSRIRDMFKQEGLAYADITRVEIPIARVDVTSYFKLVYVEALDKLVLLNIN